MLIDLISCSPTSNLKPASANVPTQAPTSLGPPQPKKEAATTGEKSPAIVAGGNVNMSYDSTKLPSDSKIEFVDSSVSYPEEDAVLPEIDLKFRNIGNQVAFLKGLDIVTLGQATYIDCRRPLYSLVEVSATYDVDIVASPHKELSHAIKPTDVDRIRLRVFRSEGGPTLTVYKVLVKVTYDEDGKTTSSQPFFLRMVGPTVPAGSFTGGVSREEWDKCVKLNTENFDKIGYKIYKD